MLLCCLVPLLLSDSFIIGISNHYSLFSSIAVLSLPTSHLYVIGIAAGSMALHLGLTLLDVWSALSFFRTRLFLVVACIVAWLSMVCPDPL